MKEYITSEFVGRGHPDKLADLISDSILTHCLSTDKDSRVACETMVKDDYVVLGGEVTTKADLSETAVRIVVTEALESIGYHYTPRIINILNKQSPDIALGTNDEIGGAGDQGIMFGFACNETPEYMGLEYALARRILRRLESNGAEDLGPDMKSQVTSVYDEESDTKKIHRVLVSIQHTEDKTIEKLREYVGKNVDQILEEMGLEKDDDYELLVNPTGRFVVGGPFGDSGVTGRKIVVDQYGENARVGGGAFSGKDPTKVDRSAAYMCRFLAKNIVASGIADVCEIEISYAIGIAKPLSFNIIIDNEYVDLDKLKEIIMNRYDLTPKGIIKFLDLKNVDYREVCKRGHYGIQCEDFSWEKIDNEFIKELEEEFKYDN